MILASFYDLQSTLGKFLFVGGITVIFATQTYRDRNQPELGEFFVGELFMLLVSINILLFLGLDHFIFGKEEALFDTWRGWTTEVLRSHWSLRIGLQLSAYLLGLCGTFYISMSAIGQARIKQWFDRLRSVLLLFRFRKITLPELRFGEFIQYFFLMLGALSVVYYGTFALFCALEYKMPIGFGEAIIFILLTLTAFFASVYAALLIMPSAIGILLYILAFAERRRGRGLIVEWGLILIIIATLLGISSVFLD